MRFKRQWPLMVAFLLIVMPGMASAIDMFDDEENIGEFFEREIILF